MTWGIFSNATTEPLVKPEDPATVPVAPPPRPTPLTKPGHKPGPLIEPERRINPCGEASLCQTNRTQTDLSTPLDELTLPARNHPL